MLNIKKLRAAKIPFEIVAGKVVVRAKIDDAAWNKDVRPKIDPIAEDLKVALKKSLAKHEVFLTVDDVEIDGLTASWVHDMFENGTLSVESGWTDPAGGHHGWGEKDPAKQYE